MVVDYDGRILAQAEPGGGEKIVVGPIDLAALRAERDRRCGHHMLSHLRMECYPAYRRSMYPRGGADREPLTMQANEQAYRQGRQAQQEG